MREIKRQRCSACLHFISKRYDFDGVLINENFTSPKSEAVILDWYQAPFSSRFLFVASTDEAHSIWQIRQLHL